MKVYLGPREVCLQYLSVVDLLDISKPTMEHDLLGKMPDAARKVPKYRTPTVLTVANRTYPIPPMVVRTMIVKPLCCVLSAIQVENMVTKNEQKNGGAVSP